MGKALLCLYQTEEKPAHLHLAFTPESPASRSFLSCGSGGGGKKMCAWSAPHYDANYYAALVIGPDGHNIEVVATTRGLTVHLRVRPQAGFAHLRPPLLSNVRRVPGCLRFLRRSLGISTVRRRG